MKKVPKMIDEFSNVDLHIHTCASKYKEKKPLVRNGKEIPNSSIVDESDFAHIDVLLNKLNESNINLFSFTDHNKFNADLFKKTKEIIKSKKYPNIKEILPGAEFDVQIDSGQKSCHILAIFEIRDLDNDSEKLSKFINEDKIIRNRESFYELNQFENLLKQIGLSVILIACQRKSINNPYGGSNCISDSTKDISSFLKFGFISALEFQKPSVEGIIKNDLKAIDTNIATVCGSDCHDWSAYPYHDVGDCGKLKRSYYFTMKAKPTFSGLLFSFTSPETRLSRIPKEDSNFIHHFQINGKDIPLSYGINSIIGENGSGKTTLLFGLSQNFNSLTGKERYIKDLLKKNNFEITPPENLKIKFIKQAEIINRSNEYSGNIFENDFSFPNIENTSFENLINHFKINILKAIKSHISFNEAYNSLKEKKIDIAPDFENSENFFVIINKGNLPNPLESKFDSIKDRLNSLNFILEKIDGETKFTNFYSVEDIAKFKESFNSLLIIRNKLVNEYNKISFRNEVFNKIYDCCSNYSTDIGVKQSTREKAYTSYKNRKQEFKDKIIQTINLFWSQNNITLPSDNEFKDGIGTSLNKGFKFVSKANYYSQKESTIFKEMLQDIFNQEYREIDKLNQILDNATFCKAVYKASKNGNPEEAINKNINSYIKEKEFISHEIYSSSANSGDIMGQTLGQKSIVLYKLLTDIQDKYSVISIDQPEDNLSNRKVLNQLCAYLNSIRDKEQIFIVTHNPILVVNLDVDNVIYVENKNGKLNIESGPLEKKNMINIISNEMDGGVEELEKRFKLYESNRA